MYRCEYCGKRNGKYATCQECGMMMCYQCTRACDDCNESFCMKHVFEHECLII